MEQTREYVRTFANWMEVPLIEKYAPEAYEDLVTPCDGLGETGDTNPALAEGGVVLAHAGIQDVGDLTSGDHGWTGAVIEITIEPLG